MSATPYLPPLLPLTVSDDAWGSFGMLEFNAVSSLAELNGMMQASAKADLFWLTWLLQEARSSNVIEGTVTTFEEILGEVRGHVLIWHNSMPEWFFRVGYKDDGKLIDQPTLRNRMEGYFKQVIQYFETTYPDVIYAWDVVNEAVEQDGFGYEESLWYQIYGGVSYIADAFQIARKYSKPPVKLFYNDYNVFIPLKTQKIIEITKPILDSGNLDGIGMQAYYNADYPGVYDGKDNIRTAVLRVAQEGFEIAFTEFTVRVKDRYNIEKDDYEKQAQRYAEILRMLLELKKSGRINITSITFFGLIDEYYSYILKKEQTSYDENEFTRLFDKYLRPKPAFYAVLNTALQL